MEREREGDEKRGGIVVGKRVEWEGRRRGEERRGEERRGEERRGEERRGEERRGEERRGEEKGKSQR